MGWWSDIRATVVAVAIGVATGGISALVVSGSYIMGSWGVGLLTIASVAYTTRQANKAKESARLAALDRARAAFGKSIMIKDPIAPRQIVYGKDVKISGNIVFAESPEASKNDFYIIICLADHELHYAPDTIYLNEDKITTWTQTGRWKTPTSGVYKDNFHVIWTEIGVTANAALLEEIPDKWTADHKLTGIAYLVIKIIWNKDVYSNGLPNISTRVNGKTCYDPRTSSTVLTENPALILLDYLRDSDYGMGFADANIDTSATEWRAEADTCDEDVDGEDRYQFHGVFTRDMKPADIIHGILDTCAGAMFYAAGKYRLRVGKYRSPTVTLDESDLRGPVEATTKRSWRDVMNQVQGLFLDPDEDVPANYPVVKSATYISADGAMLPFKLDQPHVKQPGQAQRVANITMERNRREITAIIEAGPTALRLFPGDTFYFSYSRYGWSSKIFEIQSMGFEMRNGAIIVPMLINEMDSDVYGDPEESAYDPSSSTNLPSAYDIEDPTNLVVTEELVPFGDVVGNKVTLTWDAADTHFVRHYPVSFKKAGDANYIFLTNAKELRAEIRLDVNEATLYDFKVQTENMLGTVSTGITSQDNIEGKTLPPSDVGSVSAVVQGEKIRIDLTKVSDLDVKVYEVQYNKTAAAWDAAGNVIFRIADSDTALIDGLSEGTWKFMAKALDTTGHYSDNETSTNLIILDPLTPTNQNSKTIHNEAWINWYDSQTTFPIDYYEVRKGATYASSVEIGKAKKTFTVVSEDVKGTYTYWVTAYDTAGNSSGNMQLVLTVTSPPDYLLLKEWFDNWTGAKTNCAYEKFTRSQRLTALIDTSETFIDHFANLGFDTVEEVKAAGLEFYPEETPETGSYVSDYINDSSYDYGSVITGGAKIIVSPSKVEVAGTVTTVITISHKENPGDGWTDAAAGPSADITDDFRYLKISMAFTGIGTKNIAYFTGIKVQIQRQWRDDHGVIVVAGNPTPVTFTTPFSGIPKVILTYEGGDNYHATHDTITASGFNANLHDARSGVPRVGPVHWYAKGIK